MKELSVEQLLARIATLENQLEESEQLIEAIKKGEVDAFAINNTESEPEIYTLQSGDYAYRILIEEFGEGAINITEEGLIVYTNPYFFKLLNLSYEKVIGSSIFDFIHSDSKKQFSALLNASLSEKSKGEINLSIDGNTIPVYVSLTSLHPKLPTIGIIITDLTEKKKNEQTILAYQNDLENKNRELVQTNAELASFAYIASHDLQEPLRKIQTFATRIMQKEFESLSENGKDHFTRMQNAAKRMQKLIEDLLTYSRTNTLERSFEDIDLMTIVEEVKIELAEELQQKNATIIASKLCHAHVIPFQFKQLLHNLIGNSLKFSRAEVPPVIEIKSEIKIGSELKNDKLADKTSYCNISIEDNGIGFEQQYSEKIFDLFQRLNGLSQYGGTGIGLSIVKKIVENHGGIITAKSALNKGAIFNIYLPSMQ